MVQSYAFGSESHHYVHSICTQYPIYLREHFVGICCRPLAALNITKYLQLQSQKCPYLSHNQMSSMGITWLEHPSIGT